jgi:hypothetical protein
MSVLTRMHLNVILPFRVGLLNSRLSRCSTVRVCLAVTLCRVVFCLYNGYSESDASVVCLSPSFQVRFIIASHPAPYFVQVMSAS